jgi:crossover junction endodeoxyribonuclease RuvC
MPQRIIGIDPGLQKCGIGIIETEGSQLRFLHCELIKTNPKAPLAERLAELHKGLTQAIRAYEPDHAALEETFVSVNGQSTLKLGQARGAILLTLAQAKLSVSEYAARLVKKSVTGSGAADKAQIQHMIQLLLPQHQAKSEDEADALAIAITHMHHANSPLAAA